MKQVGPVLIAFFLMLPALSRAANVRGLLSIGGDFGGDELLKVKYTDGSDASVLAGQGFLLSGGAVWQVAETKGQACDLQATAGWKYATIPDASNQDIGWTRWPLELLAFYGYRPAHLRLGGGLCYVVGPTLSAQGSVLNGDFKFQNALGEVLQLDYTFGAHVQVAGRYTWLNYHPESLPSQTFNANSAGFSLGYLF
jgi:hypothetical protein